MKSKQPPFRKLQGYAFDPSLSQQAETANINTIIYKVNWEELKERSDVKLEEQQGPGPVGEYVEVIDYDPTVDKFYEPVDLNDSYILAQDGLSPSESNPQFHQQMVYSVAMTTIQNFERALGRKILWAPRRVQNKKIYQQYVQRLRIYPHALREANAYYSPQKKALLFGYFSSTPADNSLQMPGSLVFTCLSHDIIAHETTHAILDGMHRHYNNPSNPDVLAFHEAFSDIVALFQHFTFPEVLKKQIEETRGDLASQNLLGKLAQQFGTAIGSYGSLRDAIGNYDEKGKWKPQEPNAQDYHTIMEPHARGSILVAAIFEAFINIYKSRVADLLRIASNGTGILPQGDLHPDLVNRLAAEASKLSSHVLQMCIRALDYCPPMDITFGDYLRAIITADFDIIEDDPLNYRLYFIDAFRRRGIYPAGIRAMGIENLKYTSEPYLSKHTESVVNIISEFLRDYMKDVMYKTNRKDIYDISRKYMGGSEQSLHKRLSAKFEGSLEFELLTGLVFNDNWNQLGIRTKTYGEGEAGPKFEVQNLRLVTRNGPGGKSVNQIIFSIIQRSGVILEEGRFKGHYVPGDNQPIPNGGIEFWGGCTLIFDLDTLKLRYAISKPLIDINELKNRKITIIDAQRAINQFNHRKESELAFCENHKYFGNPIDDLNEPFAFLHQH